MPKTKSHSAKWWLSFVVVVAIGFLVVQLLTPRTSISGGQARTKAAAIQMADLMTALGKFKSDNGHYPTGSNALQELVTAPVGASNWHQYLDSIPLDPWQHPYVYECPGKHRTNSYDLFSMGPDGRAGTDDDIVNWRYLQISGEKF
jgi:general secretion pathway protein G